MAASSYFYEIIIQIVDKAVLFGSELLAAGLHKLNEATMTNNEQVTEWLTPWIMRRIY